MFHAVFYKPMYNALVYIISILPNHDVATAVVILTILVKFILLPLSKKMFLSQIAQRKIQPIIAKLQEEYKDNRQVLGIKMMEVYKEHKLNPFSSILLMLIQIPIVFALYFVFSKGGLPVLKIEDLYSFTPHIIQIQHILFGIDFTKASFYIGIAAAVAQSLQIRLSLNGMHPKGEVVKKDSAPRPEEMIQKQMTVMMKYFFPVLIFFVSLKVSAAVALYWIVSSIFIIVQELYFRKKYKLVD
ncbi:MAG: YidC/Oxa1 family membrane protein insertase [Patescibacteria group bacterium]